MTDDQSPQAGAWVTCPTCGGDYPVAGTCVACREGFGVSNRTSRSEPGVGSGWVNPTIGVEARGSRRRVLAPRAYVFSLVGAAIITVILLNLALGEYPTHDPQPTPLGLKIGLLVAAGAAVAIGIRLAITGVFIRGPKVVVRRLTRTTTIPIDRVVEVGDVARPTGNAIALVDNEGNRHIVPFSEAFIDLRHPNRSGSYGSRKDALARALTVRRLAPGTSSTGRIPVVETRTEHGDRTERLRQQFIFGSVMLVVILMINRDSSEFWWMAGLFAAGWVVYLVWYLRGRRLLGPTDGGGRSSLPALGQRRSGVSTGWVSPTVTQRLRVRDPRKHGYQSPRLMGRVLQGAFVGWMVLQGALLAQEWVQYRLSTRIATDAWLVTSEQVATNNDRAMLFALTNGLVTLATGVLFIAWMRRLYRNLQSFGLTQRFSPAWVIGGWLVPILNLWRPKQIVNEIWRKSTQSGDLRRVAPVVDAWWALWVLSTAAAVFVGLRIGEGIDRPGEALAMVGLAVVNLAAPILAFWMVQLLSARQEALFDSLTATPPVTQPETSKREKARWGWATSALVLVGVATVLVGIKVLGFPPHPLAGLAETEPAQWNEVAAFDGTEFSFDYPADDRVTDEPQADGSRRVLVTSRDGARVLTILWSRSDGLPTIGDLNLLLRREVEAMAYSFGGDQSADRASLDVVEGREVTHLPFSLKGEVGQISGVGAMTVCSAEEAYVEAFSMRTTAVGHRSAMADLRAILDSLTC